MVNVVIRPLLTSMWSKSYQEEMEDFLATGEYEYLGFIAGYGSNMLKKFNEL